jgi:hypothetical protein
MARLDYLIKKYLNREYHLDDEENLLREIDLALEDDDFDRMVERDLKNDYDAGFGQIGVIDTSGDNLDSPFDRINDEIIARFGSPEEVSARVSAQLSGMLKNSSKAPKDPIKKMRDEVYQLHVNERRVLDSFIQAKGYTQTVDQYGVRSPIKDERGNVIPGYVDLTKKVGFEDFADGLEGKPFSRRTRRKRTARGRSSRGTNTLSENVRMYNLGVWARKTGHPLPLEVKAF